MLSGSFYALTAGVLSALSSFSAKLSLGADYIREMCGSWTGAAQCDWVRATCLLLVVVALEMHTSTL